MDHTEAAKLFEQWLIENGMTENSARKYRQAVQGSLNKWAIENKIVSLPLLSFRGDRPFSKIVQEIRVLDIFLERNKKGKGMYAAALRWLHEYMLDKSDEFTVEQLNLVKRDPAISSTEKEALVKSRLGQGRFRSGLVDMWGGCACTGYAQTSLLVASHIKPWKLSDNSERLDPYNGLLLTPNIDKAFDRNYISFKPDGSVLISGELESPELLSITPDLQVQLRAEHQPYMAFHREECFRA